MRGAPGCHTATYCTEYFLHYLLNGGTLITAQEEEKALRWVPALARARRSPDQLHSGGVVLTERTHNVGSDCWK
jgi:hypothetical protein